MISGLLIDALLLCAVAAFAWGGVQLGGREQFVRTVASAIALVVASLARHSSGEVAQAVTGFSEDVSRLIAVLAVAVAVYVLVARYLKERFAHVGDAGPDGYYGDEPVAEEAPTHLDDDRVAALLGAVLGLGWAVLLVAMIMLVPSDTPWTRAAINSQTGGLLIHQKSALEWLVDGFPHFTQTLPKGKAGAIVGERDQLPMRLDDAPKNRPRDADTMLRVINRVRADSKIGTLDFNTKVSEVAARQAFALAEAQRLSRTAVDGSDVEAQVQATLAASAVPFTDDVGIEVAWAHSPANAATAMLEDDEAGTDITRGEWTQAGIGIADAGWFDGRIYVVILVGERQGDTSAVADPSGVDAAVGADTGAVTTDGTGITP